MLTKQLHLPPSPEFEARTFVLVGFGAYGREIALHLIRSSPVALGQMLKIVVFDQDADAQRRNCRDQSHRTEMQRSNSSPLPSRRDLRISRARSNPGSNQPGFCSVSRLPSATTR